MADAQRELLSVETDGEAKTVDSEVEDFAPPEPAQPVGPAPDAPAKSVRKQRCDAVVGSPARCQSSFAAALNQIKAIVGVGVLSFPYAMRQAGVVFGSVLLVVAAVLVNYTMQLLIKVKDDVNKERVGDARFVTYEGLADHVLGRWGGVTALVAILFTQIGICCAYAVFLASQAHSLVPTLSVFVWALLTLPVLYSLVLIRNIRNLAPFSAFALVAIAVAIGVVVYYGFTVEGVHPLPLWPSNIFLFLGLAVFSFEGVNLAIPVHESMVRPDEYGRVLSISFVAIASLYLSFGLLGVSFFGLASAPIVTLNLHNTWLVVVIKVALMVEVGLTFPVAMHPVTQWAERLALNVPEELACNWRTRLFWKRNGVRAALVLCTVLVAAAIPFFEVVTNIVGGLGNGIAGLTLPAVLYIVRFRDRVPRWKIALHWAIAASGVALAILVSVFSVIELVELFRGQQSSGGA